MDMAIEPVKPLSIMGDEDLTPRLNTKISVTKPKWQGGFITLTTQRNTINTHINTHQNPSSTGSTQ